MTRDEWIQKCGYWKAKWPVMQPEYLDDTDGINIYTVIDAISKFSSGDAVITADAGSAYFIVTQAYKIKDKQRFVLSQSQGDMGWALPAAIGIAKAGAPCVICIVGDGSFMSNMQELAVIRNHNLNIKVVILNNRGYLSIKNTQEKYFEGRVHGTSSNTGLWFPNFFDIAKSFEMQYTSFEKIQQMENYFTQIFERRGPEILDCFCLQKQEVLPGQAFKNGRQAGLHDMAPFLSDEELEQEMIVKL